jgi:phenylpropionate dioxygenase-like ring-hydroxylating dioxygenase large terminal subunit
MRFEDFWYVIALSEELPVDRPVARKVLGEWLAVFRDEAGSPFALRDRCMHRNSRLSLGKVRDGCLECPYHGWIYDAAGEVVAVPAEGESFKRLSSRRTACYPTREQDGYVYARLTDTPSEELEPFPMPYYGQPGWETIRVINRFRNNVTNCAENFIDIPHTASVHPGIFRNARRQRLEMTVHREDGSVLVEYRGEDTNLGWWTRFLNPGGHPIRHTDSFHMPNVTSVEYDFGPRRRFFITSQSIPEEDDATLVYTDVTFNYGVWNKLARPFVRYTAQAIIDQDLDALAIQQDVIDKYGEKFANTPADTIHVFVESIRDKIRAGEDPRELPQKTVEVEFWV